MKKPAPAKRIDSRRLNEIQAGHGVLRMLFPESEFEGAEFDKALRFVGASGFTGVAPAASVVRRLVRWYEDGNPGVVCRVLDAGAFSGGMLWVQAAVNRLVRELAGGRPTVLLITGLCEAIRSPSRRWSRLAERERQENLQLLQEQVQSWSKETGTPVSLFVA